MRFTRLVRNCSVERTLAILDDAWAFLVLREFYMGARRFEQIRAALHAPRSTISDRLTRLCDAGVIERCAGDERGGRGEYRLTDSGRDLYLVMLALMRFGDDHLLDAKGPPLVLVHERCGRAFLPHTICSACGGAVTASHVSYRDGPGAGLAPPRARMQRRRRKSDAAFERNRPSSVSRTLAIMADRWTFLILREFFFGARRYEQLRENLGIATNILSDRLSHLVARGILQKVVYRQSPARFEYRLTPVGRDLYLPLIQMLRWGDRWSGHPPPLILTHLDCGRDFHPVVACGHCNEAIRLADVRYRLNYPPPQGAAKARALFQEEGDSLN